MPVSKTNTNALTKEALRVFDMCGFECWRQNNAAVWDPTKRVFRANSSTPGISDIIGYHRKTGCILAVEIKTGADRLSAAQSLFLNGITKAGGHAYIVKCVEDLTFILKEFNGKSNTFRTSLPSTKKQMVDLPRPAQDDVNALGL